MIRVNYPYLNDRDFLELMDKKHLKEQYAKITCLNWNEDPIQEIQGIVTGGTININGDSAMRRTCNLSIFINEQTYAGVLNVDNLISLNKKIFIELGYKNITSQYEEYDIIWYPQGLFVINNPSISRSSNGVNISIQCKDKMCLLDGSVGGIIHSSVQFDQYDTIDETGTWVIERPTIDQIIKDVVNHWGGEQLGRIIISDLDRRVKQTMKWIGNIPLYFISSQSNNEQNGHQLTTNESVAAVATMEGKRVEKFEYGRDVGFIYTDFTYPGELVIDAGGCVCDVLDKIKKVLGNYEYFYDIYGNFIFQEIKNYLNTTLSKVELNKLKKDDYLLDMTRGKTVYNFNNSNLITSYNNNPQYNMIKNDFIVWGKRTNANGNSIPIRYHLSIDNRPTVGNTYTVFDYKDPDDGLIKQKAALKFSNLNELKSVKGTVGVFYEYGYRDTNWNYISEIYIWDSQKQEMVKLSKQQEEEAGLYKITTKDWRTELYLQNSMSEPLGINTNYYYAELASEWPKLYDVKNGEFYQEVLQEPSDIDFFLDMIDSGAAISKFNISNIGRRSKVVVDDTINCVFAPEIPDYIIIESRKEDTKIKIQECQDRGQNFILVDTTVYQLLATGGVLNSAYDVICDLLYQYTRYNESISIQTVPIYHLEPNTRISVNDTESSIFGDYMISSYSIPLDVNATMSISATKALEKM